MGKEQAYFDPVMGRLHGKSTYVDVNFRINEAVTSKDFPQIAAIAKNHSLLFEQRKPIVDLLETEGRISGSLDDLLYLAKMAVVQNVPATLILENKKYYLVTQQNGFQHAITDFPESSENIWDPSKLGVVLAMRGDADRFLGYRWLNYLRISSPLTEGVDFTENGLQVQLSDAAYAALLNFPKSISMPNLPAFSKSLVNSIYEFQHEQVGKNKEKGLATLTRNADRAESLAGAVVFSGNCSLVVPVVNKKEKKYFAVLVGTHPDEVYENANRITRITAKYGTRFPKFTRKELNNALLTSAVPSAVKDRLLAEERRRDAIKEEQKRKKKNHHYDDWKIEEERMLS